MGRRLRRWVMNDKSELQASYDRIASQYAESLVSIWGIFVLILFIHNGSVPVNFFHRKAYDETC